MFSNIHIQKKIQKRKSCFKTVYNHLILIYEKRNNLLSVIIFYKSRGSRSKWLSQTGKILLSKFKTLRQNYF